MRSLHYLQYDEKVVWQTSAIRNPGLMRLNECNNK